MVPHYVSQYRFISARQSDGGVIQPLVNEVADLLQLLMNLPATQNREHSQNRSLRPLRGYFIKNKIDYLLVSKIGANK